MIKRADPWNNRSAISRWAHVVERIGLALAGGSCGLFVAADAARVDVREVVTYRAKNNSKLYFADRRYQTFEFNFRRAHDVKRQPLRRLLSDTGQPFEFVD